jgi:hypothetical protein
MMDLLTEPSLRPKTFSLKNAGEKERFSEENMGLTHIDTSKELMKRRVYDTSIVGQTNVGHYFESFKKLTAQDKADLIEYLKEL